MGNFNYFETLEIVESFMMLSGLRSYCTQVCRGFCCKDCYFSAQACHLHEKRRLACSVYVCDLHIEPENILFPFIGAQNDITQAISRVVKKENFGRRKSQFFNKPPESLFTDFIVSSRRVAKGFSLELADRLKGFVSLAEESWQKISDKAENNPSERKLSAFHGIMNNHGQWRINHRLL